MSKSPKALKTVSTTSDKADSSAAPDEGKHVGFHRLVPNCITLTALAAGMTSMQMAAIGNWKPAVLAIVIAAILDALDGATARLMNACSAFGAELDSLSDFLSFGVAPAFLLYMWILDDVGRLGWISVVIFAMASALRLARFNVMSKRDDKKPEWSRGFFEGVPAPAGAGIVMLPVIVWFLFPEMSEYSYAAPLIAVWTIIVAALMVSRIPTFSTKQIRIPAKWNIPVLALVGVWMASLINAPWVVLSVMAGAYLISIPLAFRTFCSLRCKHGGNCHNASDLADMAIGASDLDDDHPVNK